MAIGKSKLAQCTVSRLGKAIAGRYQRHAAPALLERRDDGAWHRVHEICLCFLNSFS